MSLDDRDWYREELARKLKAKRQHPPILLSLALVQMVLAVPAFMTPRCDLDLWRMHPIACWTASSSASLDRVTGNMDAARGYPLAVVHIDHLQR